MNRHLVAMNVVPSNAFFCQKKESKGTRGGLTTFIVPLAVAKAYPRGSRRPHMFAFVHPASAPASAPPEGRHAAAALAHLLSSRYPGSRVRVQGLHGSQVLHVGSDGSLSLPDAGVPRPAFQLVPDRLLVVLGTGTRARLRVSPL
jgi:hypothetical protein